MPTPLLKIDRLAVSFPAGEDVDAAGRLVGTRRVRAVNGVNLTVYPEQTLAVVGESGCGKSVTALSILKLIPTPPGRYDGGKILWAPEADGQPGAMPSAVRGRGHGGGDGDRSMPTPLGSGEGLPGVAPGVADLLAFDERKMRSIRGNHIAMIFQEPMTSLNPVYTIGEQILEAILLHQKVSRREAVAIAEQALKDVGIADAASRLKEYPHQLSGGMRQRVMIAMPLACQPRLLLADEPTTALDVTIQAQILELLRKLQTEKGMSVLLITHDLGVVAENADVVAVMYAGRVVEYGSVVDVFKSPLHPYTRGLFRSMPVLGTEHRRLDTIPGNVPNPADFPPGCPFHPRCARTREVVGQSSADQTVQVTVEGKPVQVMRQCVDRDPPLLEVAPKHWVACWYAQGYEKGQASTPDVEFRREPVAAK